MSKTLQSFLRNKASNAWIKYDRLDVYVRRSRHCFRGNELTQCLDIANVSTASKNRGFGRFTRFLTSFEKLAFENNCAVWVESIMEPRLLQFLLRRGYREVTTTIFSSAYKEP
jgi:hypothetical protein